MTSTLSHFVFLLFSLHVSFGGFPIAPQPPKPPQPFNAEEFYPCFVKSNCELGPSHLEDMKLCYSLDDPAVQLLHGELCKSGTDFKETAFDGIITEFCKLEEKTKQNVFKFGCEDIIARQSKACKEAGKDDESKRKCDMYTEFVDCTMMKVNGKLNENVC